jgi:hypothetical protein
LGAAVLGLTAFGNLDAGATAALGLLSGGVALSGHTTKAATRLIVNHSPEPFSNIALSLAEDFLAPFGVWVALEHPLAMLIAAVVFLALFAWLSPKLFRVTKLEWAALRARLSSMFGAAGTESHRLRSGGPLEGVSHHLERRLERMDPAFAEYLGRNTPGMRCAAGYGIRGLKNSLGYLCVEENRVVFITRRMFRFRNFTIPLAEITAAEFGRGFFLDDLTIRTASGEFTFYLLKPRRRAEEVSFAPQKA